MVPMILCFDPAHEEIDERLGECGEQNHCETIEEMRVFWVAIVLEGFRCNLGFFVFSVFFTFRIFGEITIDEER